MADRTSRDVEGIKWGEATICNIRWTGVLLRDLLNDAGIAGEKDALDSLHVCFASHAAICEEDESYSVSIPLAKVLDPEGDVLLAYEVCHYSIENLKVEMNRTLTIFDAR